MEATQPERARIDEHEARRIAFDLLAQAALGEWVIESRFEAAKAIVAARGA